MCIKKKLAPEILQETTTTTTTEAKMGDVPEIQVEFRRVKLQSHDNEEEEDILCSSAISSPATSSTDSDDEKRTLSSANKRVFNNIRLIPRAQFERLDSGSSIGEEEEPAELTEELKEKIITQAEYYFSDENLKKDGFLLKHVKRNKEGFVNLKLLASFKKMRSLSRDYRVIGEALKDSTNLVINETGLKLRRVTPLPKELLDQVRVKHIVLTKIPDENPSMNYINEAFEEHKNDVVSVRIIKPGKKFPNDLQSHFSRHPELRDETVAVVEFESPDHANEAIKTSFSNKYMGLEARLLELGPKQAKKINSANNSDAGGDSDSSIMERRGSAKGGKRNSRLLEVSGADDYPSSTSDSEFSAFSSCNKRYNRSRGNSPSTSPKLNRRGSNDNHSRNNSRNASPNVSPNVSPKNPRKSRSSISEQQGSFVNQHKLSPLVNGVSQQQQQQRNSPNSSPETERRGSGISKSRNGSWNERQSRGNSFDGEWRSKSRGNSFNEDHPTKKSADNNTKQMSPWMQRRMMQHTENLKNSTITGHPQLEIIRQPKGPDGSLGFSNHPLKKYVLVHAY